MMLLYTQSSAVYKDTSKDLENNWPQLNIIVLIELIFIIHTICIENIFMMKCRYTMRF